MNTAAIILAAGSSSRMGQSKQMLEIDGETLLERTVRIFLKTDIRKLVVVLGSDENKHRALINNLAVDIIANAEWKKGMGSSIKTGLLHIATGFPAAEAVVISVCDQPLLTAAMINELYSKHGTTGKPVIASEYSGVSGVPVLFHRSYFSKLANLPDDQGAKKIIQHNLHDVSTVLFADGATDLDTPDDYRAFLEGRR